MMIWNGSRCTYGMVQDRNEMIANEYILQDEMSLFMEKTLYKLTDTAEENYISAKLNKAYSGVWDVQHLYLEGY